MPFLIGHIVWYMCKNAFPDIYFKVIFFVTLLIVMSFFINSTNLIFELINIMKSSVDSKKKIFNYCSIFNIVWMSSSILFSTSDELLYVKKEKRNLVGHIVWSMCKNAFPQV